MFTAEQSLAYLRQALGRSERAHRHDTDAELTALARAMGYLPIVLTQTAAYLVEADLDVPAYLELLADQTRSLDEALPQEDALPDGHRDPVPTVWEITVRRAQELRPAGLARPVLDPVALEAGSLANQTGSGCGSGCPFDTASGFHGLVVRM
ncbi:hypothetical protein [Streptomyces sp. NPDC001020]